MVREYKRKVNIYIGLCFILVIILLGVVGPIIGYSEWERGKFPWYVQYLFLMGEALGVSFYAVGCCYYARSKGYSEGLGFLAVVLTIFGLAILAGLPDKCKGQ